MSKLTYPLSGPPVLVALAFVSDPVMPRPMSRRAALSARWAVTVAATAVSTWTLEVIATTAGVLLVASQVLHSAPRGLLIGFLAVTYVIWAVGLRANLTANWRLLEDTGTSTNVLSKGLFDLARRRSSTRRAERAAAASGYVAPEIAKEAPYYAGAFAAALFSDAVDASDALVFLSGTNIGAALYEYGVARLTRSYLDGRSRRIARLQPPPAACRREPASVRSGRVS